MTLRIGAWCVLASLVFGCAGPAQRGIAPTATAAADRAGRAFGDAYYLGDCPMCGRMLGTRGDTLDRVIDGRDIRFCSAECLGRFEADPASGWAVVDRILIEDQRPLYPLTTSVVSGRRLGNRPVEFVAGNRLFRVCDQDEKTAVLAEPERYLRELNRAAVEAQRPTYGMPDKCPVQGDILESEERIDIVVGGRMVRVCCMRCARVVRSRPSQYLGMVDYANREARQRE